MNWKETIEQIEKEKDQKIIQAAKYYLSLNKKYDVGDIFTDHIGSIKILRVSLDFSFISCYNPPYIKYYGIELRKDLQPKKNGAHRWAYLSNEQKNDSRTSK